MEQRSRANKQLTLNAFETLFNRHDYDAAATMWSEGYIQHSFVSVLAYGARLR